MTMIAEDIPRNRIRVLRKKARITAADLADAAGLHVSMISKIENHQRKVMPDVADMIAEKLGCRPEDLFSEGDVGSVQPRSSSGGAASIQIVPLRSLSNRSGIVGIRIPKAADESMLPRGSIAVVDLNDKEPSDGWWAAIAGLKVTLLHCDKGVWSDVLKDGNPRVKASVVEPLGRLIEYRVSLVNDAADDVGDEDVDEDIYEDDATAEHDGTEHRPGFLNKDSK